MHRVVVSKLKERLVWRSEFGTLDGAGEETAAYIDRYHRRPHSGLAYRDTARGQGDVGGSFRLQKHAA